MKERDKQHVKTVLPRIVVKFQDDVKMAYPGTNKNVDFSALKDSVPWKNFFALYPQVQVGKLFTSLTSENITQVVKKARISDT